MNWRKISIGNFFSRKKQVSSEIINRVAVKTLESFKSKALKRNLRIDIYQPAQVPDQGLSLLLFNDGQDMEAVSLVTTLERLYTANKIKPVLVVGIHAGDRLHEYGTANQLDYQKRGSKAKVYTKFITKELLPYLRKHYKLSRTPKDNAIAGFSLGGLSAFDIAWHHADLFGKVGVFSGSFWWRSKAFIPADPDANRIVHDMVEVSKKREGLKFWLQTGTNDEQEDRNNNGIIDAIDDTLDLIRALKKLGYHEGEDIKYLEVIDGEHNPKTWGKVMPDFLQWLNG